MRKVSYLTWLKQNENNPVGFVGDTVQDTPIQTYAQQVGVDIWHMPQWAIKLIGAYRQVPIPGMVRGCQAIDPAIPVVGNAAYFKCLVSLDLERKV